MKKIIRKILKEDRRQMYLDKIIQIMKNDFPLFENMELYGFTEQLSEEEINYVLSEIFGEPVERDRNYLLSINLGVYVYFESPGGERWKIWKYNEIGDQIYVETSDGYWVKSEYDQNGNETSISSSDGEWKKMEYDNNGNRIYFENHFGYWEKYEYDENGKVIYYETSDGYWEKREYDNNGNRIYFEHSNGYIEDNR